MQDYSKTCTERQTIEKVNHILKKNKIAHIILAQLTFFAIGRNLHRPVEHNPGIRPTQIQLIFDKIPTVTKERRDALLAIVIE